ncbi:hypothetical protein PBRA_007157 [Plasmodiophora brassicae]|uniref:Uncharacterized protein n=1 Tax=Plasmodiophora brassicae TaxID=37360 RepID=A0A0G4IUM2_PLABS|nr:hypothetical protein PBRA_007157 [Plasmodiophora brassicae]
MVQDDDDPRVRDEIVSDHCHTSTDENRRRRARPGVAVTTSVQFGVLVDTIVAFCPGAVIARFIAPVQSVGIGGLGTSKAVACQVEYDPVMCDAIVTDGPVSDNHIPTDENTTRTARPAVAFTVKAQSAGTYADDIVTFWPTPAMLSSWAPLVQNAVGRTAAETDTAPPVVYRPGPAATNAMVNVLPDETYWRPVHDNDKGALLPTS